jgi:glycosyltransferase involved in cell wall biosynthesis
MRGLQPPLLEAMACGSPVAASDSGSVPEIVGEAGILFDPRDPDAIATGILTSLDNRETLSQAAPTGRGNSHGVLARSATCFRAVVAA